MSYGNIKAMLKESKETVIENSWLLHTDKEITDLKLGWREQSKKQQLEQFYDGQTLIEEKLGRFALSLISTPSLTQTQQDKVLRIWGNTHRSMAEKARALIQLAGKTGYFDPALVKIMPRFLQLFSNDQALFDFLRAPQQFINQNDHVTAYDVQLLEFVIKDPVIHYLHLGQHVQQTFESELTQTMQSLHLENYGCRDAKRFEQCIKPNVKDEVLEQSKKTFSGEIIIGMAGASDNYTRKLITSTAKVVRKTKMGECHSFAQLAAEHLLTQAEQKKLNLDIKIVSHDAQLGSHTFLLINHYTDDLYDLSNCIIVDPWAYSMGYRDTQGIFTIDNYPFPSMTTNLTCCYNSINDVEHLNRRYDVNIDPEEFEKMRSNIPFQEPPEQKVNSEEARQFIEYLYGGVQNLIPNPIKEAALKEIIKDLNFDDISPSKAIKLAADIYFAGLVEGGPQEGYNWSKQENLTGDVLGTEEHFKEYFVEAFNRYPEVKSFWTNYLQINHQEENLQTEKITVESILKIGQDLANDKNMMHQYSPSNPDTFFNIKY
ncbi:hypothetical protein TUM19329_28110 [Legionella antarctica]|uniref:Uncharacterized protein n=1 Tax=Legionella antarctica TaxID=2708020 RepID=A0A6F8T8H5_9GAMM|nr:hypothetical protein [Legionella antarctica]BCA96450.1 hypothetical protein TUM19329_28110 [Legionella antarctica]